MQHATGASKPFIWDVVVIGGGASGLSAALAAARAGSSVAVLENDVACGLSVLATGNGRCNLSNIDLNPKHYLHPDIAKQVMGQDAEQNVASFMDSIGVVVRAEEDRLYPATFRAESVRDALLSACTREQVKLLTCHNTVDAEPLPRGNGWHLIVETPGSKLHVKSRTDRKANLRALRRALIDAPKRRISVEAHHVILAAGGSSSLVELFELPSIPVKPVLCPVAADIPLVPNAFANLCGQRARAGITLIRNNRPIWNETGEVQFRAYGISGIVSFDLSRRIGNDDTVLIDLFPEYTCEQLFEVLKNRSKSIGCASFTETDWFDGMLTRELTAIVLAAARSLRIDAHDLCRLANLLKGIELSVRGTAEEASAQVSRGGISFDCVDLKTLGILPSVAPALSACGEALDMDADCGGFNLAWAWLSGIRAGAHCL